MPQAFANSPFPLTLGVGKSRIRELLILERVRKTAWLVRFRRNKLGKRRSDVKHTLNVHLTPFAPSALADTLLLLHWEARAESRIRERMILEHVQKTA